MKHLLLTTIAAVVLVGCGESQQSAPQAEPVETVAEASQPEPSTAKAPRISIGDAVDSGNLEAVKQHIAAGTNLNKKDFAGLSPLHCAADYGHKEIAELLIVNGADVNAGRPFLDSSNNEMKIYYGETPLDRALNLWEDDSPEVKAAKKETAKLLRKHGGKTREELGAEESIHKAAAAGQTKAIKKHLAAGTDVNEKGDWDDTPLLHAAAYGHKEIVELLIANDADVNAKSEIHGTPLDLAIGGKHPKTADLLRKHGGKTGEELKAEGK